MPAQTPSPVITFLGRLRDNLRNHVNDDAFTAAVREARSHTGGKERARRQAEARAEEVRQQQEMMAAQGKKDDESDDDKGDEKSSNDSKSSGSKESGSGGFEVSVKAAGESDVLADVDTFLGAETCPHCGKKKSDDDESKKYHQGPGKCPDCGQTHGDDGHPDRSQSRKRNQGIMKDDPDNQMFAEGCPCCGTSKANCTCGPNCTKCDCKKTRKMNESGQANFEPDLKLFFELREFAEPPEWIPFLPTPGEYKHPKWGTVKMTAERARRMMKNFSDKVYQGHIPIDLEHSLKVSGAAGYVSNLRQNSDGSVDAKIDWTDLGRDAISKDRFRYFSPEWWDKWNHPTNGRQFNDVIVGGALTTRPFFKDSKFGGLRPLIASEGDLRVFSGEMSNLEQTWEAQLELFSEETNMGMTPEETQRFNEMFETVGDLNRKYEASEKAREAVEASLKRANETIEAMQLEKDTRRFAELSSDWPGDKSKNVDTLLQMAKAFGEDSEIFKNHVETLSAAGRSMNAAKLGLFHDTGSGRTAQPRAFGGDILDEVNGLAKAYMEQHPGTSAEVAQSMVFSEHPELYDRYEDKRQSAVKVAKPA